MHLFLPRDGFRELASVLDAVEAEPIQSTLGRLLADYIFLLRQNLPNMDEADTARLTAAVRYMVLACTSPTFDRMQEAGQQVNLTRREQIRQFIDRNLREPGLDAKMLCRELGMSRSQLYRLFERDHGVAHYIRSRRLLSCFGLLSDPSSVVPINVIADMRCFEDPSSFSRAFKQEFGNNPRDVRMAALSGQQIPECLKARVDGPHTLRESLQSL